MRQIKFRAWDKELKCMLDGENQLALMLSNGKVVDTGHNFGHQIRASNMQGIELMQFTGLLDKNGKEIYEGDIIKVEIGYGDKDLIGYIMYYDFDSAFKLKYKNEVLSDGHLYNSEQLFKIIGNIYSNSELLEEKKEG